MHRRRLALAQVTDAEAIPPLGGSESGMRPRVLLVDDNEAILMRAAGVLNTSCAIVGTELEGRAAIEAAAALQPDVIVLDISMPGMNGFEVAASLRKAGSTAARIFLTAHQDEEFIAVALAAGILGYVVTPRLSTRPGVRRPRSPRWSSLRVRLSTDWRR